MLYFGFSFGTGSLACFAWFVILVLFYNYIARYEEKLMVAKVGESYVDYMKSTNRWFPRIDRSPKEPRR